MTNLIIEPEGPVQLVPGSPVHRHGEEDEEFPERDHPGVFRVEDEEDVVDDAFRIHAARKNLTKSYYSSVVLYLKHYQRETHLKSLFSKALNNKTRNLFH